jgi:uncharacterized integral membrane protein
MAERSSARSRTPVKPIFIGLLVLLVIIVIAQNTDDARLDLLMFHVVWPLWLMLTVIAIVAFVAGWLAGRIRD